MDKIWDRNPSKSEVTGRCGGDEKNMSDVKSSIYGQGHVKIKMAVQRHFENQTVQLFVIE